MFRSVGSVHLIRRLDAQVADSMISARDRSNDTLGERVRPCQLHSVTGDRILTLRQWIEARLSRLLGATGGGKLVAEEVGGDADAFGHGEVRGPCVSESGNSESGGDCIGRSEHHLAGCIG